MKILAHLLAGFGTLLVFAQAAEQETIERGPHHTVIQQIETAEIDGQKIEIPHSYTQIGSGLNYWSPAQNAWIPSSDIIEFVDSRAVYRQAQYKLTFAGNINDPNGNLEWFPSENERLIVQTVGIAITEEETGDAVWVGQIKDTQGFLTAQNEVTWPSCFDAIDASIRVTVRPYGFENDVILHERPTATPFQGTSRLEVWHQIISGPEPVLRPNLIKRSESKFDADSWLQFRQMLIGPGTAFMIDRDGQPLAPEFYRGDAAVLWTLRMAHGETGWLNAVLHSRFRELLLHACCRESLLCPAYVLMPDHVHVVWLGSKVDSDQRNGMAFLRRYMKASLGLKLQHQAHDHVFKAEERKRNAFANVCDYVLLNPFREKLVGKAEEWPFKGAMVPGIPLFCPTDASFWQTFWKVFEKRRDPACGQRVLPVVGTGNT